eukprot:Skav203212  [mRNA]  locus=scaffold1148:122850:123688:- [translate_table: standard]
MQDTPLDTNPKRTKQNSLTEQKVGDLLRRHGTGWITVVLKSIRSALKDALRLSAAIPVSSRRGYAFALELGTRWWPFVLGSEARGEM